MNILLINPCDPDIFPVPALGYLKAYAESKFPGIKVRLVDRIEALNIPGSDHYDVIGVTVHTFALKNTVEIISTLRQRFPTSHWVAGGHHSSALPHQMLTIGFDQVVVGPGELAFSNIIEGNRETVLMGQMIADLNLLPFPDYSGLQGKWTLPLCQGRKALPIISSRGCPFECKFCASSDFWNRRWFPRSPENVVQEILSLLARNQMNAFMFEDDNFTLNKGRAITICQLIKDEVLPEFPDLVWQAASRAEKLDNELCDALVGAGCTHLWLGIESGSQKVLDLCHKRTCVGDQLNGILTAELQGIRTVGQFIVGLLGESDSTIGETLDFIRKANLSAFGVNKAWVLPGTYLYEIARNNGLDESIYYREVPCFTEENSESVLNDWVERLDHAWKRSLYVSIPKRKYVHHQQRLYENSIIAMTADVIAKELIKEKQFSEAIPYLNRSLSFYFESLGEQHSVTAVTSSIIGECHKSMRRFADAITFYLISLKFYENAFGYNHSVTAACCVDIAFCHKSLKDVETAIYYYRKALLFYETTLGLRHSVTAATCMDIARCYKDLRNVEQAVSFYRKALVCYEDTLGKEHSVTLAANAELARCIKVL